MTMELIKRQQMPEIDEHIAYRQMKNREVVERRRRLHRLKRIFRLAIFLSALACVGAGIIMGCREIISPNNFSTTVVKITGAHHASTEDLMAVIGGARPGNILCVDLANMRRHLLEQGWVKDAYVIRILPTTIEVHIIERVPVAIAQIDRIPWLIDSEGIRLAPYTAAGAEFDLPFISGVNAENSSMMLAIALQTLDAVTQCDRALASRISEINCDGESARIIFENDTPALIIGNRGLAERVQFYKRIEKDVRAQFGRIDYIDVRFAPRIYVKGQFRTMTTESGADSAEREGNTRG